MSEYQYYEFRAVDRPLNDRQMNELRAVSSRAEITPTSFVNEYNWGHFKGNPDEWMEKYFDAFLYCANWGTRRFMLRFSKRYFDADAAAEYCIGDSAFFETRGEHVVLSIEADCDSDDWMEASGWIASMIPLRSEIISGDLRCLYIAWLLCIQNGAADDDEVEPCVPADLQELSASEKSFADFFGIDCDLIEIAAQKSPRFLKEDENRSALKSLVQSLPEEDKDEILWRAMKDEAHVGTELKIRFAREMGDRNRPALEGQRRTAGELLKAAEELTQEKKRQAAMQAAAEKARKEKELADTRDKYLRSLAGKENEIWLKIEALISTKQPGKYDEAVKLLVDLRDFAEIGGNGEDFLLLYHELCRKHDKKTKPATQDAKGAVNAVSLSRLLRNGRTRFKAARSHPMEPLSFRRCRFWNCLDLAFVRRDYDAQPLLIWIQIPKCFLKRDSDNLTASSDRATDFALDLGSEIKPFS